MASKTKSPSPRRICISGFAESTRDMANRVDPDVEIWSLNRCYTFLKRWDRWYEVHEPEVYTGKTGLREEGYMDLLRNSKNPVYMLHPDPSIPMATPYPLANIQSRIRDYFSTSIAYMLAHVCWELINGENITEVMICGVDMAAFSEYSEQRPCVEYWIGQVEGRMDKRMVIPTLSPLVKNAIPYGRRQERVLWAMAKERIGYLKSQQSQISANLQALMGIYSEYDWVFNTLDQADQKAQEGGFESYSDMLSKIKNVLKNRRKEVGNNQAQLNADLNANLGKVSEAQHWLTVVGAPQTEDEAQDPVKLPEV